MRRRGGGRPAAAAPPTPPLLLALSWAVLRLAAAPAAHAAMHLPECAHWVDAYLQHSHRQPRPYDPVADPTQMVYFLHVPRTAGRTFHTCFLKLGTLPARRCPKAYDHLRINFTMPRCQLLSSHDDYSVVGMLPEDVAVLTHLRDPLDRFLSAYEFAVEVGSRAINRSANFRKRPDKIATDDVWPWSYLVPFFTQDIRARVERLSQEPTPEGGNWILVRHPDGDVYYHNKALGVSKWNITEEERETLLPELDPYDNPLVMSLRAFVRHPMALELLHNGQAFQVLGVTNYSHWGDAPVLRRCFWQDKAAQEHLLNVAERRLEHFTHVGVTDRLVDSVEAAGVAMHFSLEGPAYQGADDDALPPAQVQRRQPHARGLLGAQEGDGGVGGGGVGQGEGGGGGRRRLLRAAESGAGEEQGAGGSQQQEASQLAARLTDVKQRMRAVQKRLFVATQCDWPDESAVLELQAAMATLRSQHRELQEALQEARSKKHAASSPAGGGPAGGKAGTGRHVGGRKLTSPLGVEFQRCANRAQARNLQRRDNSLASLAMPDGRTVRFGKSARRKIPEALLQEIRDLNSADVALHKLGTEILGRNRERWAEQGQLQELQDPGPAAAAPKLPVKFPIPKPFDAKPPGLAGTDELR